ncbi:MAG: hypothetical protein ACFFBD_07295 [Candidatus Hodarchaeota archaeon]
MLASSEERATHILPPALRVRKFLHEKKSQKRKRGRPTSKQTLQRLVETVLSNQVPLLNRQDLDRLGLAFITFEDSGPVPSAVYNFPSSDRCDTLLIRQGIYFMTVLGQGDAYYQGFYGSIPVCELDDYLAYLYGFQIRDLNATDERAQHTRYVVLVLYFPRAMSNLLRTAEGVMECICQKGLANVNRPKDLTTKILERVTDDLRFAISYHYELFQIASET